jgi:hypothetical protein
MKAYGRGDVEIHIFLTSALAGGEWSASRPGRFTPGKEPPVLIRKEVGWTPEPVWTTWRRENTWPYRDSNSEPLGRLDRSQSLSRLLISVHKYYLLICSSSELIKPLRIGHWLYVRIQPSRTRLESSCADRPNRVDLLSSSNTWRWK